MTFRIFTTFVTTSIPTTVVGRYIPTKLVGTIYFDKSCGEDRDVPTSLAYTCTQSHNGGGKTRGLDRNFFYFCY